MAFDLTCLATRNAKARSRRSAWVGARWLTTLSVMSSTTALSRDCASNPPATDFTAIPAARGSGRAPASNRRRLLLAPTLPEASSNRAIDRRLRFRLQRKPGRNCGVVDRGAGVSLGRERAAQGEGGRAAMLFELVQQHGVIADVNNHRDIRMIFRASADRGGTA